MTPREIIIEQINHRPTQPVPYTLSFDDEVGVRLDEFYGGDSWRSRLIEYMSSCCGVDRRKREAIDDAHYKDMFGSIWRTDRRPFHLEEPGLKSASFDGYSLPTIDEFLDPGLKEAALTKLEENPDRFSSIGVGWGLWESYWGIRGFEDALVDSVLEPDFFAELLDRLTDLYVQQIEHFVDVPADSFMFGDDWGDQRGVIVGPDRWREFFKPRYKRIYDAVHAQGKVVMSHSCGSVVDIIPDIIEIGMDVLESVQPEARGMNPYELKKQWGDKLVFWGCLGSQSTVPFGTPDEIHAEVDRLRREMGAGGGYILAPAKGLQPETPTENAVAVIEAFTADD